MQRWNGWGDTSRSIRVPPRLEALLRQELGPGLRAADAELEDVLRSLPASRSRSGDGLCTDAVERLRHARGQSFPDLVALRSGVLGAAPDAVARPLCAEQVRSAMDSAARDGAVLVPYGGGTSVVGGVTPPDGDRPVVTLDLSGLDRLQHLDELSLLATFGAGARGPGVESQLRQHGLTLGHFPQSFERSTVGGWVATRSSGQQSLGYGRIEDLFAGGRLEAPAGRLELPPFPASAAGPDLRQVVLGSEGRLGVLTEAVLRVRPVPAVDDVVAAFLPDWEAGTCAVRTLARDRAGLSLLRLSTPAETATSLLLAGRAGSVLAAGLRLRGLRTAGCLLLAGVTGSRSSTRQARRRVARTVATHGGVPTGTPLGRRWRRSRYAAPYLRDALWDLGYGADTFETATTWSCVPDLVRRLEAALRGALDEPVHVGTHLSHAYPSGSSVYTTVVFRRDRDADGTLQRWRRLKAAATAAVAAAGGTVSHQHGVGLDSREALAAQNGPLGTAAVRALARTADPQGLLNPGKLVR